MHFEETNILEVLIDSISKQNVFYIRSVKEGIDTQYNLGRFLKEENLLNVPL